MSEPPSQLLKSPAISKKSDATKFPDAIWTDILTEKTTIDSTLICESTGASVGVFEQPKKIEELKKEIEELKKEKKQKEEEEQLVKEENEKEEEKTEKKEDDDDFF